MGVVMVTSISSNIPISLNDLGIRKQLYAALFAPVGVSREVAVSVSLLLFEHVIIASLLGFLFWLRALVSQPDLSERTEV